MVPILFASNETQFKSHGLGDLTECSQCEALMNDKGEKELELKYPVAGPLFSQLQPNRLILAKTSHYENLQAYRIDRISKEINGEVTVGCVHLSYDLAWIPTSPFSATTAQGGLNALYTGAAVSCPFNFTAQGSFSSLSSDEALKINTPIGIRKALLDGDDSILGKFGGDIVFDNYQVYLKKTAGEDRGVIIEYGVDLIDLKQEQKITEMVTGVLPYYFKGASSDNIVVEGEDRVIGSVCYASGSFERHHISVLDLTNFFPDDPPTVSQLNAKAYEWMTAEEVGQPEVDLTVSYAWLNQDVRLYDAVTVRMTKLGIDVKSKVTEYRYDVLRERPIEIKVGKTRESFLFSLEDASRLKKGLLPPSRIGAGSIGESKIGTGAVTGSKIGDGAVGTGKIGDGAVTGTKIDDGAVDTDQLASWAVSGDKIWDGAIGEDKLAEALRADIAIIKSLFADSVGASNIYAGTVHANRVEFRGEQTILIGSRPCRIKGIENIGGKAVMTFYG